MVLHLEIPRELKSPNKWQGRHWRYKHRETQAWETEIAVLTLRPAYRKSVWAIAVAQATHHGCDERRRVTVTRFTPSGRNFIRDDDNLRFSVKPVLDALKRLGLIHNDSRKWIDLPPPTQVISGDGTWKTTIAIESMPPAATGRG